jgi:hypothetical protein
MMRNVVLGVCGLLIALVAISVGGALMLRVSGVDELMREARLGIEGKAAKRAIADGRDPGTALGTGLQALDFLVFPAAVMAAGSFIGLLARGRVWPVVAIALAPLLIAFIAGRAWSTRAWVFAGCYLLLACTAGQVLRRLRPNRSMRT